MNQRYPKDMAKRENGAHSWLVKAFIRPNVIG